MDEDVLVDALRRGDDDVFAELVRRWSPAMLRIARAHVGSWQAAEDAVQDTWLAVINGLEGFEQRSALRTWVFTILVNRARTRGTREHRSIPMSELGQLLDAEQDGDRGSWVEPVRFRGPDDAYPGHWQPGAAPVPWQDQPERSAISREAQVVLETALEELPERQQLVVRLRDVHDLSSQEVCDVLDISAANQRVLLHRGRSRLRAVLEGHYLSDSA